MKQDEYSEYKKHSNVFAYLKAKRTELYYAWFVINTVLPVIMTMVIYGSPNSELSFLGALSLTLGFVLLIFIMFKMYFDAMYPSYLFKKGDSKINE